MREEAGVRRWSLRAQSSLLVVALLAMIAASATAIVVASARHQDASRRARQAAAAAQNVQLLAAAVSEESNALRGYALTGDRGMIGEVAELRSRVAVRRDALVPLTADPAMPTQRTLDALDAWQLWADGARSALVEGGTVDFPAGERLQLAFELAARVTTARADLAAGAATRDADGLSDLVVRTTVGAALVGTAGLLFLAWLFFCANLRPLAALIRASTEVAAGRRTEIPTADGSAELRQLAAALEAWRNSSQTRLELAEANMRLGEEFEVGAILRSGGRTLAHALDASVAFMLSTGDPEESSLVLHCDGDRGPEVLAGGLAAAAAAGAAVGTGSTVAADLWDPAWSIGGSHPGQSPRWVLAVPLKSGGRILGAAIIAREGARGPFSAADEQLAELSVPHIAAAVHTAQLLDALKAAIGDLQAASRHKTEFLAHMSHELRTPLNSVLGFAQLLLEESFGPMNERQRRYVGHIEASGRHLLALINDVLDLSRVESGQLDLQAETVPLGGLLRECVEEIRPLALVKRIELRVAATQRLAVHADRRRLAQVVLNLLSNAVKFTPEGGRVTVGAGEAGGEAVITVRDSGIGIPAADQQQIFEPFTQLAAGRTRGQEGTGLGLALSRRLVEQMQGSITVESREGKGSAFRVRLPAAAAV